MAAWLGALLDAAKRDGDALQVGQGGGRQERGLERLAQAERDAAEFELAMAEAEVAHEQVEGLPQHYRAGQVHQDERASEPEHLVERGQEGEPETDG